MDEVVACAGSDVVGRPHFAEALIRRGYVHSRREAFSRYLARGRLGYAERRRTPPDVTMELIRDAGGIPVIAHPFSLELKGASFRKYIGELRDVGLAGIEVYYPEHTRDMQREYQALARDFSLLMTGGSDFHGSSTPDLALGRGFGSLRVPDELFDRLEEALQAAR